MLLESLRSTYKFGVVDLDNREPYDRISDDCSTIEDRRSSLNQKARGLKRYLTEYSRYLCAQGITDLDKYHPFAKIIKDARTMLRDASDRETEIRARLQLQTGHLALYESNKSIGLATLQIEESKRGKFITNM